MPGRGSSQNTVNPPSRGPQLAYNLGIGNYGWGSPELGTVIVLPLPPPHPTLGAILVQKNFLHNTCRRVLITVVCCSPRPNWEVRFASYCRSEGFDSYFHSPSRANSAVGVRVVWNKLGLLAAIYKNSEVNKRFGHVGAQEPGLWKKIYKDL